MDHILENDRVYVSLVGPFLGYYARIPGARSDIEARILCAATKGLKHIWMSVYTKEEVLECIERYGGQFIALDSAALEGWDEVYELRASRNFELGA